MRGGVYDGDAEGCIRGAPYSFPLGECARTGNIEGLRYQLDHGADINEVDYRGESALILASFWDQLKCVELLLERGADVHRIGCLGNALCQIQPGWRPNALDIAQLLLARGCSPTAKADYCESAVQKWTDAAKKPEKKVALKLLQLLELLLPHAGDRAPLVSAAIDGMEQKLGKSAVQDKAAAASLDELATASSKTWAVDVHKAAGTIDKNGETIQKIISTVLPAPAAVKHPKWSEVVRAMIGMSKTYGDATKAAYGKALPLSRMESDEGGAMDYFSDEHLYTWDWVLAMLAGPLPQSHDEWADLVVELCEAKRKAVGYYSFGDEEIAALLTNTSVKERPDFDAVFVAAKKAFPYASCFGADGSLRDYVPSAIRKTKAAPTRSAPTKASPKKAAPKQASPKKAAPKKPAARKAAPKRFSKKPKKR